MEIDEIRQELNDLLENVVDHSGRYTAERPIPSLEISFVLSKINKMQENLTILKYLLEQKEMYSKKIKKEKRNQTLKVQEEIVVTETTEEKIVVVVEEKPTTGETIVKEPIKIEQQTILKLIDALTLNDRYLYANELFNKDMNAFNEFVKSVDNSSTLSTAKEILFSLNLDIENQHVASFSELIDRRFS